MVFLKISLKRVLLKCSYFLIVHFQFGIAQEIKLYSDTGHRGTEEKVDISKCSNLPSTFIDQASSINTNGACGRLFDGPDCTGNSIEIFANSPSHYSLVPWDFNDKTKSTGPCRESCDPEVTGRSLQDGESLDLEIFSDTDQKGSYADLKVGGCTIMPIAFRQKVVSVHTFGRCFDLYNNVECLHEGENIERIELRLGTPAAFFNDLRRWGLREFKAVSPCSYKCHNNSTSAATTGSYITSQNESDVILFDSRNFKGNLKRFLIEECVNVGKEWEGVAVSIRTFFDTCVILYNRRNCQGKNLKITASNGDLSNDHFSQFTRSLRLCSNSRPKKNSTIGSNKFPLPIPDDNSNHKTTNSNSQRESATKGSSNSVSTIIIVASVVGAAVVLVVVVAFIVFFVILRKNYPWSVLQARISEKEIQEFLLGIGGNSDQGYEVNDHYDVNFDGEVAAQYKPYNEAYEIPRSRIHFDIKSPLGAGEFGVVYKGFLTHATGNDNFPAGHLEDVKLTVAVKTLKTNADVKTLRSLLKEVKVMMYVGAQENVVRMVGCCTENLREGEIFLLVEFCSEGSLESFLRKNREKFKSIVEKGKIRFSRVVEKYVPNYLELRVDTNAYENTSFGVDSSYDFFQLLQWCVEIANGMTYLSSKKIIHADLATRNILLDKKFCTKISDFGLSKKLYYYTQYIKKPTDPVPWRWSALESLKNLQFSTESDIWSYGVVCWEIFTLGEVPYAGVSWSENFVRNLEDGYRLPKPKFTISECFNLMLQCWNEDPKSRPTFPDILQELRDLHVSLRAELEESKPTT